MMGEGVAFTAHGRARGGRRASSRRPTRVVAVELRVERVQDHLADGRTEMLDGARWRWARREHGEARGRDPRRARAAVALAP